MKENWPIRLVSVSNNGKHIAVAARYGIITYDVNLRKWCRAGDPTSMGVSEVVFFSNLLRDRILFAIDYAG